MAQSALKPPHLQVMICALALMTALRDEMQSCYVLLTFNNASICSLRKAESSDMACSFLSTCSIGQPRMRAFSMAGVMVCQQGQYVSVEVMSARPAAPRGVQRA